MNQRTALRIASTGLQEIRLLLNRDLSEQALEVVMALQNLPTTEQNTSQADATKIALQTYLNKYPDRSTTPHWKSILFLDQKVYRPESSE